MRVFQIISVLILLTSLQAVCQTGYGDDNFGDNENINTPASARRGRAERTPQAPRRVRRRVDMDAHQVLPVELDPLFAQHENDPVEMPLPPRALAFDDDLTEEPEQDLVATVVADAIAQAVRIFAARGANPCGAQIGELGFSGF